MPRHFFRPNIDGKAQAEHFLKRIHLEAGDLPPVLDLEVTDDVTAVAIRREAKEWQKTPSTPWPPVTMRAAIGFDPLDQLERVVRRTVRR